MWVKDGHVYTEYEYAYGQWHYDTCMANPVGQSWKRNNERAVEAARMAVAALRKHGPCEPKVA